MRTGELPLPCQETSKYYGARVPQSYRAAKLLPDCRSAVDQPLPTTPYRSPPPAADPVGLSNRRGYEYYAKSSPGNTSLNCVYAGAKNGLTPYDYYLGTAKIASLTTLSNYHTSNSMVRAHAAASCMHPGAEQLQMAQVSPAPARYLPTTGVFLGCGRVHRHDDGGV
jgi:hypothetical protein